MLVSALSLFRIRPPNYLPVRDLKIFFTPDLLLHKMLISLLWANFRFKVQSLPLRFRPESPSLFNLPPCSPPLYRDCYNG